MYHDEKRKFRYIMWHVQNYERVALPYLVVQHPVS